MSTGDGVHDGHTCGCASGPVTHCGRCAAPATQRVPPPGQPALSVARSTYSAAFDRMRRRLSAADLPALDALTARHTDVPLDPALALLDGWACVGHVLGFYTDRLVNEHHLRTCRQRRSAVELSRLVGYTSRPGVAADVHLAFTLADADEEAVLAVPAGTRAYSQPGPGETMQPFETSEALTGRPRWNVLRPRLTAPQRVDATTSTLYVRGIATGLVKGSTLVLQFGGTSHLRTVADVVPLPAAPPSTEGRTRVELVDEDEDDGSPRGAVSITTQLLQDLVEQPAGPPALQQRLVPDPAQVFRADSYATYGLLESAHPALRSALGTALGGTAHAGPTGAVAAYAMRVTAALHGHNASLIPVVNGNGIVVEYREWAPDGTGAAPRVTEGGGSEGGGSEGGGSEGGGSEGGGSEGGGLEGGGSEGGGSDADTSVAGPPSFGGVTLLAPGEIALDAVYGTILPGSLVALVSPVAEEPSGNGDQSAPSEAERTRVEYREVAAVRTATRVAFNLPVRVTVLALVALADEAQPVRDVRQTVVHAQSEALDLVEAPISEDVSGGELELDGYYPGLQPGRRVIVTGERTDILRQDSAPDSAADQADQEVTGVTGTEVVVVSGVQHCVPGTAAEGSGTDQAEGGEQATPAVPATQETLRTVLTVEPGLRFRYRRESVQVFGNVAHATHGEGRAESLGSGDATRPLQTFPLKQGPLTYVPAATPSGVRSTLEVDVEDLRWHEAANAAAVLPGERRYVVRTDDEGGTAVTFGLGARLPTGQDNVRASYRSGLGSAGNVRAGQISVLASRPNGVMGVTNPAPAAGGADRDDLEAIRQRAPVGLTALDRLVSAVDVEDFARAFAGIGKARIDPPQGPATAYTLTVAGVDDAPLAGSASLTDLRQAIARFGDLVDPGPGQPLHTRETPATTVTIAVRTAFLIAVHARIRLAPDHLWEAVHPRVRAALFAAFGFEAREIGQVPQPGEAMAAVQSVRGVAWVDLVAFGTIDTGDPDAPRSPEDVAEAARRLLVVPPPAAPVERPPEREVGPSTIAYLSDAPATLLLEQVPEEARP